MSFTGDELGSASRSTAGQSELVNELVFGSLAGIGGKIFEYPFDTVKVRLQSQAQVGLEGASSGAIACFRDAIVRDGFLSLYRGMTAPMAAAAIENSSLFFSYDLAQRSLRAAFPHQDGLYDHSTGDLTLSAKTLCGGVSGAVTSLLLTPIELVKCKMQMPSTGSRLGRPSASTIVRRVLKSHGLFGLWHGQTGTLLRETGGSAAWFGAQAAVTLHFQKKLFGSVAKPASLGGEGVTKVTDVVLPIHLQLLAGAAAGMSYNFILYPADTIKSCMQTQDMNVSAAPSGRVAQSSFMEVGRKIWKTDGLKGLYRGCGITVFRAGPSSALIFYIHDSLARFAFEWQGRR